MVTFISWIKKGDEFFFLTDQDVFSKRGRELFKYCKNNDVLGHGAIRLYYGKEGKPLQGGTDYEERDFWKTEKLPKEIQSLHPENPEEFMKHWGRMWRKGVFQNAYLHYIICYAPESWKEKAWDQLMKRNPSNYDLRCIICYASDSWKEKAWDRLMEQNPSNDDLRDIIRYAPESWKEKACARLMKRNPSDVDLRWIIRCAPESWKEKACAQLMKRNPSDDELFRIFYYAPDSWKEKARAELKKRGL